MLALALAVGWLVAIALTPPIQLYSSGARNQVGPAPENVVPDPAWGAGALAAAAVLVVLVGAWIKIRRRRAV